MSNFVRSSYKLFVGNLPWTIGNKQLTEYFSKYGHVATASVIFDKQQGFSKNYGFVTFSSRDGLNAACNQNLHFLEGRVLNVEQANSGYLMHYLRRVNVMSLSS